MAEVAPSMASPSASHWNEKAVPAVHSPVTAVTSAPTVAVPVIDGVPTTSSPSSGSAAWQASPQITKSDCRPLWSLVHSVCGVKISSSDTGRARAPRTMSPFGPTMRVPVRVRRSSGAKKM